MYVISTPLIFLRQQPSTMYIRLQQDDDRALHNPESSEKALMMFVQVCFLEMGGRLRHVRKISNTKSKNTKYGFWSTLINEKMKLITISHSLNIVVH